MKAIIKILIIIVLQDPTETCSSCPADFTCAPGQSGTCNNGTWSCTVTCNPPYISPDVCTGTICLGGIGADCDV